MQKISKKFVKIFYWTIAIFILFTGVVLLLDYLCFRFRFTDYCVLFLMTTLLVIGPILVIPLFLLNRKCRRELALRQHRGVFVCFARAIFVIAWPFFCLVLTWFFWGWRLWPLCLWSGPNTSYAYKGFEDHIGFAPPSSVSRIYYRNESGLDSFGYLRFQTNDIEIIKKIIRDRDLVESEEQKANLLGEKLFPIWWVEKDGQKDLKCYCRVDGYPRYYLWYNPLLWTTWTVWYEEVE